MITSLLDQRTAVVTGGGDIGGVIARGLQHHGAKVEIWDRSAEVLNAAGADGLSPREVDVTDLDAVVTAAEAACGEHAGVEIVVNSAAIAEFGSVTELDPAAWQHTIDVNLTGVFNVCRAFVPSMRTAGRGSIVNISSIGGLRGEPDFASYCASKFAVIGFTQSLAREVGPFGVRANCVCPGAVESRMNTETMARDARRYGISIDDVERRIVARTSLQRLVQPTDIANAVVFLASDLSSCITAESISVTGGVF
jgi:NAD(P)-dependent dehydrogenase (short-subunit alcohol dehydrogenase family)